MTTRFLILALLLATPLFSLSIEVHPESKSAISNALSKSRAGDTIIVYPGIYKENIIISSQVVVMAKEPLSVTIKGDSRGSTVTLRNDAHIDGIIVTGGNKGVSVNYGDASINNCIITGNRGSGIFAISQFPRVTNTVISYNGTGIMAQSVSNAIILKHLTIVHNSLYGINFPESRGVTISQSIFFKNETLHFNGKLEDITFVNSVVYPKQKRVKSPSIISRQPQFATQKNLRKYFVLTSDSPGFGTANEKSNIGALLTY